MTPAAVLDELEAVGVTLLVDDAGLVAKGPRGAMTPAVKAELAEHKQELLEAIANDTQAREAGLCVMEPGALYHTRPVPTQDVIVEREGDRWVSWVAGYRQGESRPQWSRLLYRGTSPGRAIGVVEKRINRRRPPW